MRLWRMALLLLGLASVALAQGHPSEATVARFPSGVGLVISSDGLVAVPTALEKGGAVTLGGARLKAAVVASKPGAPFALLRIAGGPFPTVALGSSDLVSEGDNVLVWTASGERQVSVRALASDPVSNHRYLCLDLPYEEGLLGWPVLHKGEAVALITGAEPGRPGCSRAVSVQELKLFLFNEGFSLTSQPHPALANSPGSAAQPEGPRVEEWSFPLRSGTQQRTSDLLALDTWRYSFGAHPALLAPLAVDGTGRLYLATSAGTLYCLDFDRRQMEWRAELDPGALVLDPPRPLPDGTVLVGSGQLGVLSVAYRRTGAPLVDLFQDISGRARNTVSSNAGDYYALAGDSGAERWKAPTRFPSTPIFRDGTLLVSGLGLIGAIDVASGKYRWAQDRQSRGNKALWHSIQQLDGSAAYGIRVPVEVHGGLESDQPLHLRSADDAEVVALDWQSGREIWACKLGDTDDEYQPLGVKLGFDGARLYAVLRSQVFVVDKSGKLVHSYRRSDDALADRLLIDGSTLYGGDSDGWYAVSLSDGRVLWRAAGPTPEAAPILLDGTLYGTSHHSLTALEARTGQKLWEHTFAHRISGQPALRDQYLYLASLEGMLYRVELP